MPQPDGGRTAKHRRQRLAALAAEYEFTIVEDTVLDQLNYAGDPGSPLWALAPERVLAAGSQSKVAWGRLRIGWLRAPRPVVLRLGRVKASLNLGVGALDQLAALELFADYEALCARQCAHAAARMQSLVAALGRELPDWSIESPEGGWSLWITLPTGSGAAFAQTALRHGVAIVAGSASSPDEAFAYLLRACAAAARGVSPPAGLRVERVRAERPIRRRPRRLLAAARSV